MKTINQVLLALFFIGFTSVGFAQSQTTLPESTVKRNDDKRFKYDDLEDEDDNEEDNVVLDEERIYLFSLRPINQVPVKEITGYSTYAPNRD